MTIAVAFLLKSFLKLIFILSMPFKYKTKSANQGTSKILETFTRTRRYTY